MTEAERLAQRLAALRPDPGPVNRDRLLFEAGRRSARSGRLWPAASVFLALTCAALTVRLWQMEPVVVTVLVPAPAGAVPTPPPPPSPPESLPAPVEEVVRAPEEEAPEADGGDLRQAVRLRRAVFRWGVDALPAVPAMVLPPTSAGDEDLTPAGPAPRLPFPFRGGTP
jgi:hypothetical protein